MPNSSLTNNELLSDINRSVVNIETLLPQYKHSETVRAECENIKLKAEELRERLKSPTSTVWTAGVEND